MISMSLNSLGLKFDILGLITDLEKALNYRVSTLVEEMVQSLNSVDYEYSGGTYKQEMIKCAEDEIKFILGSDHFYAWIVEFGRGSLLDESNPFLAEYKASDYWNDKRPDNRIRSRQRRSSPHIIPDWQGGHGTTEIVGSNYGGRVLEHQGNPMYDPIAPRKPIRNAIDDGRDKMISAVREVFRTFPYSDYIKGGG
ncbi:hypothetical protein KQI68_07355 [Peptoniphilus sp. MSJ-1]|uniref:Phage protein, HK97 gp10 family n=1 Tax=Peptoniphilus ovalis TaxID=2841503 RepID=A0ABS6FI48_9FIRM|nr:hypothetical protein [Peptoniphilus ovalis]MBU5669656.1 hypothetical protein [Peptoniphilus ovalis]